MPIFFLNYEQRLMHFIFETGAFFTALGVACYTHYHKIVQNEYFGYPDVKYNHCILEF
jgi:hypothetical protein